MIGNKRTTIIWVTSGMLLTLVFPIHTAIAQQTLRVSASTQLTPLISELATAFHGLHRDITIDVTTQRSDAGMVDLRAGRVHFAAIGRPPLREELRIFHQVDKTQLVGTPIAMGAVAMIVRPDNPLKSMTVKQAMDVTLQLTFDWSKLDVTIDGSVIHEHSPSCRHPFQKGVTINLIVPPDGVDTLEFFRLKRHVPHHFRVDLLRVISDEEIAHMVSFDANAIGLVSWASYNGVRIVAIRNEANDAAVLPTYDSILDRTYPLAHYLYLYQKGAPSENMKAFIAFMTSTKGQKIVKKVGGVPLPLQTTAIKP